VFAGPGLPSQLTRVVSPDGVVSRILRGAPLDADGE